MTHTSRLFHVTSLYYNHPLRLFQLNRDNITVYTLHDELIIKIKGSWLNTILFEVPVLAIVSEVFFRNAVQDKECAYKIGRRELAIKRKLLTSKDIKFADFGTRRRFSREWQEFVIDYFIINAPDNFVGTSNVYFALVKGLKPIGTQAHEFFQACQALTRLEDSQKFALETWVQEYRGQLGIALTDSLGMDAFLKDFDLFFAKLFDGCRHDSGFAEIWCRKLINHYEKLGIDPKTKTAVFSDGLDFPKMIYLYQKFSHQINVSFGIGTNLTNDVGVKPLQIVIKMTRCNDRPVAKISDSPGKQMCNDPEYLKYLASVFNIERKVLE